MRAWQREVAPQIRTLTEAAPLAAIDLGGPAVCGRLDDAALAAGRLRPEPGAPIDGGRLPLDDASQATVLVSFVGSALPAAERRRLLGDARRVLAPEGRLLVVDHNRPRRRLAALAALVASPAPPGGSPGARWRRLAYTTAREVQDSGVVIEALRLAAGERVQLVIARAAGSRS